MKIAIIVILAALAVAALCGCSKGGPIQVMDGDGMVYEWTNYELCGDWVQIDSYDPDHPLRMTFSDGSFKLTDWNGKETSYKYALPEGTDTYGKPEGEVYLNPADFPEFDNLIFHEEDMGEGKLIPIISGTVFEYDGRGEVVFAEFARTDDVEELPEDFRSSTCITRNDREAIPSYMEMPATDD